MYQSRRQPNIVQSLVDLHRATSVQEQSQDTKTVEICWDAPNSPINLSR